MRDWLSAQEIKVSKPQLSEMQYSDILMSMDLKYFNY